MSGDENNQDIPCLIIIGIVVTHIGIMILFIPYLCFQDNPDTIWDDTIVATLLCFLWLFYLEKKWGVRFSFARIPIYLLLILVLLYKIYMLLV